MLFNSLMLHVRAAIRLLVAPTTFAVATLGLAACANPASPGPSQPPHRTSSGKVANSDTAAMVSDQQPLGTVDPGIAWLSGAPRTATLISASLIPVPGFRLPRLVSVGVVGCEKTAEVGALATTGAPNTALVNSHSVRLRPVRGYRMSIGGTGCSPVLVYWISSRSPGPYAVGGLLIKGTADGRTTTVTTYVNGLLVWFYRSGQPPSAGALARQFNQASAAQAKLAGLG